jgi:hypothetical protein
MGKGAADVRDGKWGHRLRERLEAKRCKLGKRWEPHFLKNVWQIKDLQTRFSDVGQIKELAQSAADAQGIAVRLRQKRAGHMTA